MTMFCGDLVDLCVVVVGGGGDIWPHGHPCPHLMAELLQSQSPHGAFSHGS